MVQAKLCFRGMRKITKKVIDRVRCIIPHKNGIILIKREIFKKGRKIKYYVFPGGGVEYGETAEQALKREAMEELGIEIEILKKLYTHKYKGQVNAYFLCKYLGGVLGTGVGPEFTSKAYSGRGTYTIEVIPFSKIPVINLVPSAIRDKLIKDQEVAESVFSWS